MFANQLGNSRFVALAQVTSSVIGACRADPAARAAWASRDVVRLQLLFNVGPTERERQGHQRMVPASVYSVAAAIPVLLAL